jgi:hypothetical protein
MNNKNISDILNESAQGLNLSFDIFDSSKVYNIVEFCDVFLKMPKENSIDFCNKHIGLFDSVQVKQETLIEGPIASAIGDKIKSWADVGGNIRGLRGRKGISTPRPALAPSPLNLVGKAKNFLGTNSAVIQSSPMIKVSNNRAGTTDYYVFPSLNLKNPGHYEILQDIIKGKTSGDSVASQVNDGDPERFAAQRNNKITNIDVKLAGASDQRAGMTKALQDLSALINTKQKELNNNLVVSPQEVAGIKQQATDILNQLSAAASQPVSNQEAEQTADTAIKQIDTKEQTATSVQGKEGITVGGNETNTQPITNPAATSKASNIPNQQTIKPASIGNSFRTAYRNALQPTGTQASLQNAPNTVSPNTSTMAKPGDIVNATPSLSANSLNPQPTSNASNIPSTTFEPPINQAQTASTAQELPQQAVQASINQPNTINQSNIPVNTFTTTNQATTPTLPATTPTIPSTPENPMAPVATNTIGADNTAAGLEGTPAFQQRINKIRGYNPTNTQKTPLFTKGSPYSRL